MIPKSRSIKVMLWYDILKEFSIKLKKFWFALIISWWQILCVFYPMLVNLDRQTKNVKNMIILRSRKNSIFSVPVVDWLAWRKIIPQIHFTIVQFVLSLSKIQVRQCSYGMSYMLLWWNGHHDHRQRIINVIDNHFVAQFRWKVAI